MQSTCKAAKTHDVVVLDTKEILKEPSVFDAALSDQLIMVLEEEI